VGRQGAHGVALLASLLAWACGGAGPSAPTPQRAGAIVVNDGAGLLRDHRATIEGTLVATLAAVNGALAVPDVTITVTPNASRAIGGYGIGGFTPSGSTVEIYVDASFPGLAAVLPDRLRFIASHELHHARRWRGPGYGRTLLAAMVSEGLADRFAVESLGAPPPPWSDAFPRSDTQALLDLARPELDSTSYDHDRWFFGASASPPRWTGYTLGYRLVEAYQAAHPGATAAQLVDAPAAQFRP
jgi:uncharacterized protein YjaZ